MKTSLFGHLRPKYGEYAEKILALIKDNNPALVISREPALIDTEILYAIYEEMALHLSDVVLRRTGFGNTSCPSRSKLEAIADVMAKALGWSSKQKDDEICNVLKCYHPLPVSATANSPTNTETIANFTN
jgi:glycerol-3-phosphate dehydrogenase